MCNWFLIFLLSVDLSYGVIYSLNESEYDRMPPLVHLDSYYDCFNDDNPLYCSTKLDLVTETSNDLFDLIRNYSEWTFTHYNHSSLYRGVCLTRTCRIKKENISSSISDSLEACLNESFSRDYGLKTKISTPLCYSKDDRIKLDLWDMFVGISCATILAVNVIATSYDVFGMKKFNNKAYDVLMSFSIKRNWKRFHSTSYREKPPVDRLKGLDGARAISMVLLLIGHSLAPYAFAISDSHNFERMYNNIMYHIFLNGLLIVQIYFVMSGMLLSYNIQRLAEKKKLHWTLITSYIFKRWLRLTPMLAIILAIISTLLRYAGSGPLWQYIQKSEIDDCRRYWFWNLFYLANYKNGSNCMIHTWYVSADMHLYCYGVIVLVLVRNSSWRKVVLGTSFILGLLAPGFVTYFYDMTVVLLVSPESIRRFFVGEPSFDYLYKPTHNNICSYIIGLCSGILVHELQKNKIDIQRFKKFKILYWATVPSFFGVIFISSIFYVEGSHYPLSLRVMIQVLQRPVFGALFALFAIGMVFKMESIYRGLAEWNGWSWMAKVSYSAYLFHFTIIRLTYASSTELYSLLKPLLMIIAGVITVSFLGAVLLWLLVEAPMSQIVAILFESRPKQDTDNMKNVQIVKE